MTTKDVLQLILIGIGMGSVYALVALGFHIVFQATEVFNFAHGELVVMGGLISYSLTVTLHMNLWLAVILVTAVGFLSGLLFERVAIRPIDPSAHLAIIISTVAMGIVLENSYLLLWAKEELPVPAFSARETMEILGVNIPSQYLWVFGLSAVAILAVEAFFHFTLTGKAIRATAFNRVAAMGMGINPRRMVAYSFGLSAALAMLAGMVMAPLTLAGGAMGPVLTVKGFTAAILGGITRAPSVVMGGFLLGVVESLTAGLISSQFRDPIALSVLLLVFMLQPKGIFLALWSRRGKQWRSV